MKRTHSLLRRAACLLLAVCLIAPVFCFSASAKEFTDLYRGMLSQEFMNAINYVSDNGWMNGVTGTTFAPYDEVTRGMFVTVLYRYADSSEKYAPSFTDVSSSMYYYYPIGWAARYGIAGGVSSTKFEPESVITKEQMITMLYRFSKSYEGTTYSTSLFPNIFQYSDYSAVSEYAREPMRWAKSYCVLSSNVDATYLNPQTVMNRAYASLYLANFSKNAGVWKAKDRFSFSHTADNFHDKYYMNSRTMNYLYKCIDNYYSTHPDITNNAQKDKDWANTLNSSSWSGSCYGLTMSLYLDKIGCIDFNRNVASGKSYMSQVPAPITDSYIESAINFYHTLAYLEVGKKNRVSFDSSTLADGVESMYNYVRQHGAALVTYGLDNGIAHAIIVRHITKGTSSTKKTYTLSIIDTNYSWKTTATIDVISGSAKLDGNRMTRIAYSKISYPDDLLSFDLDGYLNNVNTAVVVRSLPHTAPSTVNIQNADADNSNVNDYAFFTSLRTDLLFQSSSGESLTVTGADLSGTVDMSTLNYVDGEPVLFSVDVSLTDQYEYVNLSNESTNISFCTSNGYAQVSGSGIDRVVFHRDTRRLELFGTDMTYRLYLGVDDAAGVDACLSGTASGDFSVAIENGAVVTTGLTGTQSWGFSVTEAIYPAMTEAEFPLAEPIAIPNVSEIVEANRKWEAEHYGES